MNKGESPQMFTSVLLRRLPQKVRAKRRVMLYDNACYLKKVSLRRFPHRIRQWHFLIDRHHLCNHTSCSRSYNMDFYPFLKSINSQICEQKNRKLRKLANVVAYENFENYMKIIEIFFALTNMEIKGIM